MTIFGTSWADLGPDDVEAFLGQADDEPLLWEAKGTELDKNEIRRQVCAFANGHEVSYLILGADRSKSKPEWSLDGVEFPGGEPGTWIAEIVGDPERGVRPRPDFDVVAWEAEKGHVAIVRVTPTSTPPCISNETIYERLPGKTQTVRDPLRLAGLYARGEEARRDARLRADRMAENLMDELDGDAGTFQHWSAATDNIETEESADRYISFSVGVAATGNPPNLAGRLFKNEFAEEIWQQLAQRPTGFPQGFGGGPPDAVEWSQDALTWRHQMQAMVNSITLIRASWDGTAGGAQKLATDDVYVNELAERRLASHWRLVDELVERLGGFGDVYVSVQLSGGRFPRRREQGRIAMRRGPMLPGVSDEHVASLGRELMRAIGNQEPEP